MYRGIEVLPMSEPDVRFLNQNQTATTSIDDAFEALFAAEYAKIVKLGYVMTRSDAAAQDAAQHAFVALFERWSQVDNPVGFVRTAALNRLCDDARHASVRRRFLQEADKDLAASDPDYLADALLRLPLNRRAIVVLRFYERRTIPEIAEMLEIPAGSVKSGLSRAMEQLRGELT